MYTVFENKGKQYNLKKENKIIYLDYQKDTKPGNEISFSKASRFYIDGNSFKSEKVKVVVVIVKHGLKRKIYVLGYQAKKRQVGNNLKGQGHRQKYTEVRVIRIEKIEQ